MSSYHWDFLAWTGFTTMCTLFGLLLAAEVLDGVRQAYRAVYFQRYDRRELLFKTALILPFGTMMAVLFLTIPWLCIP